MNPELKTKWVAALRSGQFKQGRGRLHFYGTYCCIGVLAVVQGVNLSADERFQFEDSICTSSLPENLMAGLDQLTTGNLADMNDGHGADKPGMTFAQIADYIEAHL